MLRSWAARLALIGLCTAGCGGASLEAHERGIVWARSRGRECHRGAPYHGACQGPRRVPVAQGEAAERARSLGIGTRTSVTQILRQRPPEPWIDAVEGEPPSTLLWPVVGGTFHRGFGFVRHRLRTRHDGIDILARPGTHIRAAADGLVGYSDNRVQGFGNLLVILHTDGTSTLYAHCRRIFVAAGEMVRRGQIVAEVGDTGISRMPHLHFEWHRDGEAIDPEPMLSDRPPAH